MTFTFPTDDLDNPQKVLFQLGSWWGNYYGGRGLLLDRMGARTDRERQAHIEAQELFGSISRLTVPVHHVENYWALELLQSQTNDNDAAMLRYDGSPLGVFDGSPKYFFDVPLQNDFVFEIPPLADCWLITNRITEPSVVLHKNVDYLLDAPLNALVFRQDPFANPLIPQEPVYQDGVIVDYRIVLWLVRARFDREHIHTHFGHVLSYEDESSLAYRDAVNAAFDAIVDATALAHVEKLVSLMAGIPLTVETGEVVEDIVEDGQHKLVLTDKQVYKFPRTATVTVAKGDTLREGQSLVDDYELWEFRTGEVSDNVAALVIGRGILGNGFFGDLVFENTDVPLEVTGDTGQERVEFEIKGHPLDVELFWDTVHANRLVYGQGFYDLLRVQGQLPATINPMEFIVENILRNNAFAIRISVAGFGAEALGLKPAKLLRRIVPPHTTLLLIVELPGMSDSATMLDDGSFTNGIATGTGQTTWGGQTNLNQTSFTAKHVSFTCQ